MADESNYSPYGHPKGHMDANGNWVRNADVPIEDTAGAGPALNLEIPISAALADAAVLFTVDEKIHISDAWYEITDDFTGGTSAAIGISTNQSPHNDKGDLLGGPSGDVANKLTEGSPRGTKGPSITAGDVILNAGTLIRFDRIASAFTSGEGVLHIVGRQDT